MNLEMEVTVLLKLRDSICFNGRNNYHTTVVSRMERLRHMDGRLKNNAIGITIRFKREKKRQSHTIDKQCLVTKFDQSYLHLLLDRNQP